MEAVLSRPTRAASPVATAVDAAPAKAPRWLALDMLRFVAVFLMVQGHTFTALLDRTVKAQGWYPHHSFVHGYTAPMFLFGAGLAFGYTTFRRWDAHTRPGPAVYKRVQRYLWLMLIGYGMHLPMLSLARLAAIDDPDRIAHMLQVDVLQHIAVSLAFCQLLVFVVKRRRAFVWIVGALGALFVFAAPWVWSLDLEGGTPIWLAGYVNASTGSIFPIVPWAGFTYLGIVVAYAVGLRRGGRLLSDRLAWPLLALATFLIVVPIVFNRIAALPYGPHNFWKTNPLFFFWRLGNVVLVLSGLCFLERWMRARGWLEAAASPAARTRARAALDRALFWVKLMAAESLVIYVVHLIVLHGSVLNPGVKQITGTGGLPLAVGVTAGIWVAMMVLARSWTRLKKVRPTFHAVQLGMVSFLVLMLVSGR